MTTWLGNQSDNERILNSHYRRRLSTNIDVRKPVDDFEPTARNRFYFYLINFRWFFILE